MRRVLLTFIFAVAAAALCRAQEQSLGELARQKSSTQKASHVYTEEDIPTHPATAAPEDDAPSSAPDAQSSGADNKTEKSSAGTASDKPASAEVQAAKKTVQEKQVQIDYVSRELAKRREQLSQETDSDKIESLQQAISNLEGNIAGWTTERNNAQKIVDKAADQEKSAQKPKPAASGDSSQH
jgi:hypothetical protein